MFENINIRFLKFFNFFHKHISAHMNVTDQKLLSKYGLINGLFQTCYCNLDKWLLGALLKYTSTIMLSSISS